jgi:hypothetical protein
MWRGGVDAREAGNSPAALDPVIDPDAGPRRLVRQGMRLMRAVARRRGARNAAERQPEQRRPARQGERLRRPKSRAMPTMSPTLRLASVWDRSSSPPAACWINWAAAVWSCFFNSSLARRTAWANAWMLCDAARFCCSIWSVAADCIDSAAAVAVSAMVSRAPCPLPDPLAVSGC